MDSTVNLYTKDEEGLLLRLRSKYIEFIILFVPPTWETDGLGQVLKRSGSTWDKKMLDGKESYGPNQEVYVPTPPLSTWEPRNSGAQQEARSCLS